VDQKKWIKVSLSIKIKSGAGNRNGGAWSKRVKRTSPN